MQTRKSTATGSANREAYQKVFVQRVHELLQLSYLRMHPVKKWEPRSEEDISGELARHIDEVLDELSQPWMHFFGLEPERHVDEPQVPLKNRRLGKHRRRLDLRFRCRQRKPVLRFVYEAKVLCQSKAHETLLGDDGLGRYLTGRYAREDSSAGLLGYVQLRSEAFYASALETELNSTDAYKVTPEGKWSSVAFKSGPVHTFVTRHMRTKPLGEVTVYFALLKFF